MNRFLHLSHAPHHTEFLGVNKALQHDAYSHVDVILLYIITEVHTCVSLCHSDHRFNVTHRNRDAAGSLSERERQNYIKTQEIKCKLTALSEKIPKDEIRNFGIKTTQN